MIPEMQILSLGHLVVAAFTKVLGPFENLTSYVRTQFPTANIVDATGKVVQENFKKETPDHILVEGTLASGALASLQFRAATKTIDGHGITWTIAGSKGEIEIRGEQPGVWQMQSAPTLKLLKDSESEVEVVDYKIVAEPSIFGSIPGPALNVGRVYEAFATRDTQSYATFENALALHYLLENIIQTSK
jgi:predicted dehydrogenase